MGLFRVEPGSLQGAEIEFMEQTTIQEIRLCVREHDENGKLHISCVWDLRGEIDAVALAQLKLQEDMPIASVSHSITLTSIPVWLSFLSYLGISIHSASLSHHFTHSSFCYSHLTIPSSTHTTS